MLVGTCHCKTAMSYTAVAFCHCEMYLFITLNFSPKPTIVFFWIVHAGISFSILFFFWDRITLCCQTTWKLPEVKWCHWEQMRSRWACCLSSGSHRTTQALCVLYSLSVERGVLSHRLCPPEGSHAGWTLVHCGTCWAHPWFFVLSQLHHYGRPGPQSPCLPPSLFTLDSFS
jgi:hypothetical protein